MTTFDFGAANSNPSVNQAAYTGSQPTPMTSMSGGAPRQTGGAGGRRTKPKPKHVPTSAPSGWDSVAAAKNEVFKDAGDDDEPPVTFARPMPAAPQQQATTFDFNSFGTTSASQQ